MNPTIDGATWSFGQHPDRDTWHDLGVRSLVIERRLEIDVVAGEGSFQLLQRRRRPADRGGMIESRHDGESLVSHALYFGPPAYDPPGTAPTSTVPTSKWFHNVVLALRCDPDPAAPRPSATRRT